MDEVIKVVTNLKDSKAVGGDIPTEILKECEFTLDIITACINKPIETGNFPDSLKMANVTPVFKNEDPLDKTNYRPVSILPLLSSLWKGYIEYIRICSSNNFPDEVLFGFRNTHITHHAIFKLLRSWQKSLHCGGFAGTKLTDLSKAYDCIPHELLIAKLHCYGVNNTSLKLLLDYLTNRKQRTKIGSSFSSWHYTDTGVPQGSILGPLLFNIFINDLFISITKSEVCNFADDNTLYSSNKYLDHAFNTLCYDLNNVLDWFKFNSLTANPDKFQFTVLGANTKPSA